MMVFKSVADLRGLADAMLMEAAKIKIANREIDFLIKFVFMVQGFKILFTYLTPQNKKGYNFF